MLSVLMFVVLLVVWLILLRWTRGFFMPTIICLILASIIGLDEEKLDAALDKVDAAIEEGTIDQQIGEFVSDVERTLESTDVEAGENDGGGFKISIKIDSKPSGSDELADSLDDAIRVMPSALIKQYELDPEGIRDHLRESTQVDVFPVASGWRVCHEGTNDCWTDTEFLLHETGVLYATKPGTIRVYIVRGNDG